MEIEIETCKIYKITSEHTNKVYIGSTTRKKLRLRFNQHKNDIKRHENGKYQYCTSFEIIKYGDAKIELIEEIDIKERKQRERYYIDNLNSVNKVKPKI